MRGSDVRSYAVEAAFLGSTACAELIEAGHAAKVHVPKAFAVDLQPCDASPLESRFALLLQDFGAEDGWAQRGLLNEDEARAALTCLGRFHAFFWEGSSFWRRGNPATSELEAAVWPAGGYWQPSMQPASQFSELATKWKGHLEAFGERFSRELDGIDLSTLGERLERLAPEVAAEAHPFDVAALGDSGSMRHQRTLIHGDPKAANLFVRTAEEGDLEVGLIDFQWCGFGLAATDVAHHICAALSADCLSQDGAREAALLDHSHAALCAALVEAGVAPSAPEAAAAYPRATLQSQYEAGVLDMCRLVFGYQWSRANFDEDAPNKNAYNKSLRNAVWLVARCDALLTARGG